MLSGSVAAQHAVDCHFSEDMPAGTDRATLSDTDAEFRTCNGRPSRRSSLADVRQGGVKMMSSGTAADRRGVRMFEKGSTTAEVR